MREKPFYDRAMFWLALGGAVAAIGGILWDRGGYFAVAVGAIALWWSLTLYLAHRHAETHSLRDGVEGMVAQASRVAEPIQSKQAPTVPTSASKQNIDLDLVGLQEGWVSLTSAQEEQFVDSNLLGKLARVSGQVADVRKNPGFVLIEINRKEPIPTEKARLNVQLFFDSTNEASFLLLNKGDIVNVRGEVMALKRNQYSVPQLVLSHCRLLKD